MALRLELKDSAAAIYINYAKGRLRKLKDRLDSPEYAYTPHLEQRIRFDTGTEIFLRTVRGGVDIIRIESGLPVLFLYHTVNQNKLAFSVYHTSSGLAFVKTVTNIPVIFEEENKMSLTIVGKAKGMPYTCDSAQTREIKYLEPDAFLGFVQAPTPYHDSHVDDGVWCYNYIALLRKWFPVNFAWYFYGSEYGTQFSYEPVDIGERNWQLVERTPGQSSPYGEYLYCGGRHPYELYDDPDDEELHGTLLYKDIHLEGEAIHVPFQYVKTERTLDLSFFSTMYGSRKRIYRMKYTDQEGEQSIHLFDDVSDNEARTCKQYTPLAVITHNKALVHVDEYSQAETPIDSTYFGSIGRYGTHDQYHTYCCAYIYIALRILYRDPDSGESICEEVYWQVQLTCAMNIASQQTRERSKTIKTLKHGDINLASENYYIDHQVFDQNPTFPFFTVGRGDRPDPNIDCPWPTVASGANDWNLLPGTDEREIRTWGAKFSTGPLRYSDHVSDPLTGMALIDNEDTKTHSGIFELTLMDYDNYKDEHFIGIIKKLEIDSVIRHTTLFYFNEDADLLTYQEIERNDRYRVNEGPAVYEWDGISSYPVLQSFTGQIYYLVDGKPRIRERDEDDKRIYHYELVVLVDKALFRWPITWTGHDHFTYRFNSVQEVDPDLLQVSELTGLSTQFRDSSLNLNLNCQTVGQE